MFELINGWAALACSSSFVCGALGGARPITHNQKKPQLAPHATTKQIKFILFLWIVWLVCSTASRSSSLWAPCLGPAAPAIISHNSTSLAGSLLRRIRRSIAFLFTQLIRKSWSEKRKDNCWWRAAYPSGPNKFSFQFRKAKSKTKIYFNPLG